MTAAAHPREAETFTTLLGELGRKIGRELVPTGERCQAAWINGDGRRLLLFVLVQHAQGYDTLTIGTNGAAWAERVADGSHQHELRANAYVSTDGHVTWAAARLADILAAAEQHGTSRPGFVYAERSAVQALAQGDYWAGEFTLAPAALADAPTDEPLSAP